MSKSLYCGLFDAKIRASDNDLPVLSNYIGNCNMNLIAYLKYETANHTNSQSQTFNDEKKMALFTSIFFNFT